MYIKRYQQKNKNYVLEDLCLPYQYLCIEKKKNYSLYKIKITLCELIFFYKVFHT